MDILESQAVLLVVLCEEFQKKMRRFLQVVGHEAVSTAWPGPAFVMMGTSGKNIFFKNEVIFVMRTDYSM